MDGCGFVTINSGWIVVFSVTIYSNESHMHKLSINFSHSHSIAKVIKELGLGNNNSIIILQYCCIAIVVSRDFCLPISLQWQNIVLLQLNNSLILCS